MRHVTVTHAVCMKLHINQRHLRCLMPETLTMCSFKHIITQTEGAHSDQDSCQVCRQSRIRGLADALYVYGIPGLLLHCEGALRLKLHCVVGAQLDMLRLGQVPPPQPQRCPCKRLKIRNLRSRGRPVRGSTQLMTGTPVQAPGDMYFLLRMRGN